MNARVQRIMGCTPGLVGEYDGLVGEYEGDVGEYAASTVQKGVREHD